MEIDNNHVRLGLVASALIVSLSIGYYLVIFLPDERRANDARQVEEQTFRKEIECREQYDKLQKISDNVVGVYYSALRNTCMVKFTDDKGDIQEAKITDAIQSRKKPEQ